MKFLRDAWPVVVIVATIAGAAWTAGWNVRDFLITQIAASEARLAAQIAASEARREASDARLTGRMAEVEARQAQQAARLAQQIAELRQLFIDHLEDHANAR